MSAEQYERLRAEMTAQFSGTDNAGRPLLLEGGLKWQAMSLSAVERAMAALPDEQRIAVALVLIEGLSYEEAATVLETPVGTVTSRLSRGRAALQAALIQQGTRP